MAQDTDISCSEGGWTEITADDATTITFQVKRGKNVLIKATTGSAPSDFTGAKSYSAPEGERGVDMADFSPGISATRVFAYPTTGAAKIACSHD